MSWQITRSKNSIQKCYLILKKKEMKKDSLIYIAGHNGLVGSAIERKLRAVGYENILTINKSELNLTKSEDVENFFSRNNIEYVFDAAAKVGGINANNKYSADFIYQNTMIQSNLIHNSWRFGVKKFLFLGSVCIYPKLAPSPVKEESLFCIQLNVYGLDPPRISKPILPS